MTTKLVLVRTGLTVTAVALLFVFGWWWFGEPRLAATVAIVSVAMTAATLSWESQRRGSPT
jgi:hypothetical protein